jgi:endonuclease/exonuclease/phosphatase family metal-dependent hydrolase
MLSVMTLNIWNDDGPWPQRAKLIREQIDELNPDLIGLVGEEVDLLKDILNGTSYHHAFAKAVEGWPRDGVVNGNAVISRWPIKSSERLVLPTPADHNGRAALIAIIDSPHGPLCFTSTHLSWRFTDGAVREKQVRVLADRLMALTPEKSFPPIVVGDFNSVRESAEIRYLTGLQTLEGKSMYLRDAWFHVGDGSDGLTWTQKNPYIPHWLAPERRIDYVFVGAPNRDGVGEILSCRVICNQPIDDVWPSDHFGVYAELRDWPVS